MAFNVGEMVLFYVLRQELGFLATIFSIIHFFPSIVPIQSMF